MFTSILTNHYEVVSASTIEFGTIWIKLCATQGIVTNMAVLKYLPSKYFKLKTHVTDTDILH